MNEPKAPETHSHQFAEVVSSGGFPADRLTMDGLENVRLEVTADLGRAVMLVREILELRQGSVIPLDKMAGETTDVCVNGIPMAKGEVVIIADSIHIRVAEILGAADHEKDSYQDET